MNQNNWINVDKGTACIIDNKGNILLQAQVDVDRLYYPSHGMCQVEKDGKFGYIDMKGNLVIPFQYKKAFPFSENGLAFVVGENGLGGYIDTTGEFILDPIYETGSMFKFGFAAVSRDGQYKYIYKNGSQAIGHIFKYAGGFSDCGLAKVVTFDGAHSFMDTMSRQVLLLKKGNELMEFKEGSRVTKFRAKDGREALINAAGEIFTGFFEKVMISSYSHLNPFLRNGLWGYVDDRGNEVIPNIYQEVSPFTADKVAKVKAFHPLADNQSWEFYINEKDEIVDGTEIERREQHLYQKFSIVSRFEKGLALAVKQKFRESTRSSCGETKMNEKEDALDGIDPTDVQSIEAKDSTNDLFEDTELNKNEQIFEVEIYFHDMDEGSVQEFIQEELSWVDRILDVNHGYVKFLWIISDDRDREDIENGLFYFLKGGEIGTYNYTEIY